MSGFRLGFVGKQRVGKSTIINALLGKPGFLPVDVVTTTDSIIHVSHGARGGAAGRVRLETDGGGFEEGEWTALRERCFHRPQQTSSRDLVLRASVEVEAPWLSEITLVDVPGTDSQEHDGRHARLARVGLSECDAAVLVAHADMGFGTAEEALLRRAVEVGTDVLAVFVNHPRGAAETDGGLTEREWREKGGAVMRHVEERVRSITSSPPLVCVFNGKALGDWNQFRFLWALAPALRGNASSRTLREARETLSGRLNTKAQSATSHSVPPRWQDELERSTGLSLRWLEADGRHRMRITRGREGDMSATHTFPHGRTEEYQRVECVQTPGRETVIYIGETEPDSGRAPLYAWWQKLNLERGIVAEANPPAAEPEYVITLPDAAGVPPRVTRRRPWRDEVSDAVAD